MKKIIATIVLGLAFSSYAHAEGPVKNCSSKFYNPAVKCYEEPKQQDVEDPYANQREAFAADARSQAYRDSDTTAMSKEARAVEHCKAATEIAVERFYIDYGKMPTENQIMVTFSNCFKRLSNK